MIYIVCANVANDMCVSWPVFRTELMLYVSGLTRTITHMMRYHVLLQVQKNARTSCLCPERSVPRARVFVSSGFLHMRYISALLRPKPTNDVVEVLVDGVRDDEPGRTSGESDVDKADDEERDVVLNVVSHHCDERAE